MSQRMYMGRGPLTLLGVLALAVGLVWAPVACASFGLTGFQVSLTNENGSPDVQAGSHPWGMTTSFQLNKKIGLDGVARPEGDPKDVVVDLPAGLVGNPQAVPKCTQEAFSTQFPPEKLKFPETSLALSGASCPADTQVGVAQINNGLAFGVYNMVPPPGVPAELAFSATHVPVLLVPHVRPDSESGGGGYALKVVSKNTNQTLRLRIVTVKLWGVPADPSHDGLRGECLSEEGESLGSCPSEAAPEPFLRLPTSCPASPPAVTLHLNSWQEPLQEVTGVAYNLDEAAKPVGLQGCEHLPFVPTLSVLPDTSAADSASGLAVDLHMPQEDSPTGVAEADLRDATVQLPQGMAVSPSAASGLGACTSEEIGIGNEAPPGCPSASKIGSVEIETPLLAATLKGGIYLAEQNANPFGSLLAIYLTAEGSGVLVKLAGRIDADHETGQLTTKFENNPQVPFSDLRLRFFGGPRAALLTPATCGTFTARGSLAPWSETPALLSESSFTIDSGCVDRFSPSFLAGTSNNQAGAFSPLTTSFARADEDQPLGGISVQMPPGLLGMVSHVPLCEEPAAATGACPQASRIGHVNSTAGPGPDPLSLPQPGKAEDPVYLTGRYGSAPFGLTIVVPAEAGPFNLGEIVERAAINIDPHTAALTITADPLPTIKEGIPLDIRSVEVVVDREGFIFNPTNCESMTVGATITSTQGASAARSNRFQAANCAVLPFKPTFSATTDSRGTHADGVSLDVRIGYPKGVQANIHKVAVALPRQLPSRLTTIRKACLDTVFNVNPAACPAGSLVGTATAQTPVLNVPLTGPAYLVSHGGAAFPDLVMVLQGQGVVLELVGSIFISKGGITSSTFASVPDAPVSNFELKLPTGPSSALTVDLPAKAKGKLCGTKLLMPTTIIAQNGAQIKQDTTIAEAGCPKSRKTKPKSHHKKHRRKRKRG